MAYESRDFRGRNDDGTEATATWIDSANVDWSQEPDITFRVRLNVHSTSKKNNAIVQWQYSKNSGTWTNITTISTNVKAVASGLVDGNDCVQRLGSGSFETSNQGQCDNGTAGGAALDIAANFEYETECGLQIVGTDTVPSDTIELRVLTGGTAATPTNIPSITVAAGATPVTVPVTGVAGTGQFGAVTVIAVSAETVVVTGLSAAGSVGSVTVAISTPVDVSVTGVEATGLIPEGGTDTYYFDASVSGPTDNDAAWSSPETDAFDGSLVTDSACSGEGTVDSKELRGTGSTAPASGGSISQVRVRLYAGVYIADNNTMFAEILDGVTSLGIAENHYDYQAKDWGDYVTLDAPDGGWTWAKLNTIECVLYGNSDGVGWHKVANRVDLEVTTSGSGVTVIGEANVDPAGIDGTGEAGSVTVSGESAVDVPVTGITATGIVGSATAVVATSADVTVTGLEATGFAGTADAHVDATILPTGLVASGQVGGVSVSVACSVLVTGLEATGEVGSVTVVSAGNIDVNVTGQVTTGGVGSVEVDAKANVIISGLEATGPPSEVTITTQASVGITGVIGTGEAGEVTVSAGGSISVPVTGLEATGDTGQVSVTTYQNIAITGLSAASVVGQVTIATSAGETVSVTGLECSGEVESADVGIGIICAVTGVGTAGEVGSVVVTGVGLTQPIGNETTGQVNSVDVIVGGAVDITGLEATGSVGDVIICLGASVVVAGLEVGCAAGQVNTEVPYTNVYPTGVESSGEVGSPFILAVHVPNQNPNYTEIKP